ncbi:MAG TPA: hypothetical protein VFR86_19165 [Burkholderiaceae bacterium]|nr:hypothetical protein [Burkholderiaceae bacterium]
MNTPRGRSRTTSVRTYGALFVALALSACAQTKLPPAEAAQKAKMSFFVTSVGLGKGANLGGLDGADRHCQALAGVAGAGDRTWRAYLSATATDNTPAVNARDRIGDGPWHNAKGVPIAANVSDLHGSNLISAETALTERGATVPRNRHDILTGSQADGTAFPPGEDHTCRNWTSSGEGAAMVGHHNRMGLEDSDAAKSWNASHLSRGCSQEALRSSGGDGLFYCFALK